MATFRPLLLAPTLLVAGVGLPGPAPAGDQTLRGVPGPVHTLLADLAGDYAGLPEQLDTQFGFAVALHGDTLAVGAPGTRVEAALPGLIDDRGAVFVFRRDPASNTWLPDQRLD